MARKRQRSSRSAQMPEFNGPHVRTEVAQVAARLMAEDSIHDFGEAKARAAASLGLSDRRSMPGNDEVEAEIRNYQALFQADEQPQWLAEKRRIALAMMDLLAEFRPCLAGAVLRGTAAADSEITLHLLTDPPERVASFLYDRQIPWELDGWEARFGGNRVYELPMYRIIPEGQPVRLIVFPEGAPLEAPRSVIDGRPMQRATRDELAALLEAEEVAPGAQRPGAG